MYNIKDDIGERNDVTWDDRETRLKHSLLVDALVDFELRMGVYDFSGVDDLPLLTSYYTRQRLAAAALTAEQDTQLAKMDRTLGREIRETRIQHGIDLNTIHRRDHETSRLRAEGVKGAALLEGMIASADLTAQQGDGFRAIVKRQAKYQVDVRALLTLEQRKLIARN